MIGWKIRRNIAMGLFFRSPYSLQEAINKYYMPFEVLLDKIEMDGLLQAITYYGLATTVREHYGLENKTYYFKDGICIIGEFSRANFLCANYIYIDRRRRKKLSVRQIKRAIRRDELVLVWQNGQWVMRGVWDKYVEQAITSVVEFVNERVIEINTYKEKKKAELVSELETVWGEAFD